MKENFNSPPKNTLENISTEDLEIAAEKLYVLLSDWIKELELSEQSSPEEKEVIQKVINDQKSILKRYTDEIERRKNR